MTRSEPACPPQLPRAASKRTTLVRFEPASLLFEADYHESWGFHKAVVERFANMRLDAIALKAMGVVQVRLWWSCYDLERTAPVGAGPSEQRFGHPMMEEEDEEESTAPEGNTGAALGRLREEALLLFGGKTGAAVKRRQSMFESYKTEAASLALMAAERADPEAPWAQTQALGGRTSAIDHSIELLAQARTACGHFFGPRNKLAELFDQAEEELRAFLRVQSSEFIQARALLQPHDSGNQHQHAPLSGINMLASGSTSGASHYQPDDCDDRELQEALAQSLKMDRATALEEAELQEALAQSLNMVVQADVTLALKNYEIFNQLKPGLVTREQVAASSAGINGWAKYPLTARRHVEAEEDDWPRWVVLDEGKEGPSEDEHELEGRCPVHPPGDREEDDWPRCVVLDEDRVQRVQSLLDEDKEGSSEDELEGRCPVHPRGDHEEEQSLQRALLASLGHVVTFGVLDDWVDDDDRVDGDWAMQALGEAYERLAIETKVKEAIQADNTNEAVKELMAVAKEHQLQCAAHRSAAACLAPSRSARPAHARYFSTRTLCTTHALNALLHALHCALHSPSMIRTLPTLRTHTSFHARSVQSTAS